MNFLSYSSKNYLAGVLFIFAFILVGVDIVMSPPTSKGIDVPDNVFSAERAFAVHSKNLEGIGPHPAGTEANSIVRERISAQFKALGFEVEHQSGFNCDSYFGGCSTAINIIARKPGRVGDMAVAITGHYDSVPAAQGASDDGMGVATMMEIARISTVDPQYMNDVVFLVTDAEEVGLKGAVEFVEHHPLKDKIGAMISIESRGTDGPSSMFETSDNNNALIDIFKENTKKPIANSLFYEIYKRMPNDTDYSIFKKAGIRGLNFANSQAVVRYHSEYDDLEHMSRDTLQHNGENALGVFRAFANMDLTAISHTENATYFDIFGIYLVKWSDSTGVVLSIFSTLFIFWMGFSHFLTNPNYGGGFSALFNVKLFKEKSFTFLGSVLIILLTIGFGWLLSFPLGHWVDIYPLEHPYPWPGRIALFGAALLVLFLVSKWFTPKFSNEMNAYFIWGLMTILSLVTCFLIPGISYLFLFPSLLFVVGLGIDYMTHRGESSKFGENFWGANLGMLGGAYLGIYHYYIFDVVLNFQLSHFKLIPVLLFSLMAFPVICQVLRQNSKVFSKYRNGLIGLIVIGVVSAQFVPSYTLDRPRGMNLNHIENASSGEAIWVMDAIGNPDFDYLEEAGFGSTRKDHSRFGLRVTKGYIKGADFKEGEAPVLNVLSDVVENGVRVISGNFRSVRGGYSMLFGLKSDAMFKHVKINGEFALQYEERENPRPSFIRIHGLMAEQATFEISIPEGGTLDLQLIDFDFLTEAQDASTILNFRPDDVKPIHGGDRSIIYKTFSF